MMIYYSRYGVEETVTKLIEALTWVAQTTHQAQHTSEEGSWLICPKPACREAKRAIDEANRTLA